MEIAILIVFIVGYAFIALEHPVKIDKAASALIMGMVTWALYAFVPGVDHDTLFHGAQGEGGLYHHLFDIASILFFLLGAMTIVELVDAHEGFSIITNGIKTKSKVKLIWIIAIITFFMSAVLDNLTTAIVMISLLRKLIDDKETRWLFAGIVIIAANAGGAWSPIGDVTTTMLWIKGQLPDVPTIILNLFIPSLICVIVPLMVLSLRMKGEVSRPVKQEEAGHYLDPVAGWEKKLVFFLGLGGLLFVPVFKTITHLQPFMGMMLSLGVIWLVTDLIHRNKKYEDRSALSVLTVLRKIDTSSVLFFLGILMAVGALQEVGHLAVMATTLDQTFQGDNGIFIINILIGLLSAIVDNVPLVAAAQGMYTEMTGHFVPGGLFWQFLAYCAGTGGSVLIIGSAAGVAVMGLERIDFIWYLKRVSMLALFGYLAGAFVYILMFAF